MSKPCPWTEDQTERIAEQVEKLGWLFRRPFAADALAEYLEAINDLDYDTVWAAIQEARKTRKTVPYPATLRELGQKWARRRAYAISQQYSARAEAASDAVHCDLCDDTGLVGRECSPTGDIYPDAPVESLRAFDKPRRPYRTRYCECRGTNPRLLAKQAGNTAAIARTSGPKEY